MATVEVASTVVIPTPCSFEVTVTSRTPAIIDTLGFTVANLVTVRISPGAYWSTVSRDN